VFSLLTGVGNELGIELVRHPAIKAVGFTGSRGGGLALMAAAAARPVPIPVYAEMSSINPVFLLPQALKNRAEDIAAGFAGSLTLGVGQMCTNPGLVLAIAGPDLDRFNAAASQALAGGAACSMLSPGIAGNFARGVNQLAEHADVKTLALAPQAEGKGARRCSCRRHRPSCRSTRCKRKSLARRRWWWRARTWRSCVPLRTSWKAS
jgi:NADP-dependent aldehyde dehydrogenase